MIGFLLYITAFVLCFIFLVRIISIFETFFDCSFSIKKRKYNCTYDPNEKLSNSDYNSLLDHMKRENPNLYIPPTFYKN